VTQKLLQGGWQEWRGLFAGLFQRFANPFARPIAIAYLLGAVVFFAGASIWYSVLKQYISGTISTRELDLQLLAYGGATVFTALADLMLERTAPRGTKFVLVLLAFGVVAWLGVDAEILRNGSNGTFNRYLLNFVLIWLVWWMVSGSDPRFQEYPPANVAAGGEPMQDIS
jgi:hypothetical protein